MPRQLKANDIGPLGAPAGRGGCDQRADGTPSRSSARDAFWQYPREIVYEPRQGSLFRLDIDHVVMLFIRAP
jgi:hypothetical protein